MLQEPQKPRTPTHIYEYLSEYNQLIRATVSLHVATRERPAKQTGVQEIILLAAYVVQVSGEFLAKPARLQLKCDAL